MMSNPTDSMLLTKLDLPLGDNREWWQVHRIVSKMQ